MHLQAPQVPASVIVRAPVIGSQWAPLFAAEHRLVVPGEPQSRRHDGGPADGSGLASPATTSSTADLAATPTGAFSRMEAVGAATITTAWRMNATGVANCIISSIPLRAQGCGLYLHLDICGVDHF